jgi:tetratricopeptide (TPR) repeat protein
MVTAAEAIAKGVQARKEKDLIAARTHYAAAAELLREQGDVLAYAHAIRHIADMFLDEEDLAEAKPLFEESLEIYRGNLHTTVLDLANTVRPYALLQEMQGNVELARELWLEARNLYGSLRLDVGVAECEKHLEKLAYAGRAGSSSNR